MAQLERVETRLFRIPLPSVLADSTHGEMTAFELATIRVGDADGVEGVGDTYTVGRNGRAVRATGQEIAELALGAERS